MKAEKSIEIKRVDCGKYVIHSGEKTFEVNGISELISFLEGIESNEH